MVKQIIPAIAFIILLGSCSSLKPLNFSGNKPVASTSPVVNNSQAKFLDQINVTAQTGDQKTEEKKDGKETAETNNLSVWETPVKKETRSVTDYIASHSSEGHNISPLQQKYAVLINTDAEQLQNQLLLEGIDEWYGTRYHMGGTTKQGVDCSAFVCAIYASVFSVTLPRTAKYQYRFSRRISRTELQEGDLLFFNTRGGISHVGIYLQNNKFVHASVALGVTISDMFEPYYLKHFIGAGRIDNKQEIVVGH